MDAWLWWVAGALLFAVVEMLTLDLIFAMLAAGAVLASVAAALGAPLWLQIVVFAVGALLGLTLLRPWGLRRLFRKGPKVPTNYEAYLGRMGVVVQEVSDRGGRVKVRGEVWTARTEPGAEPLPVGVEVTVLSISGATVIVERRARISS